MSELSDERESQPVVFAQAFGLGFVAGMRSMMAPAAIAASASPFARWSFRFLAAGELVGDKLPQTPSRLSPLGLSGRIMSGAGVGYVICRRAERSVLLGALCGAAGALAGSYGGYYGRKALGKRTHLPDPIIAVVEDTLALGLSLTCQPSA